MKIMRPPGPYVDGLMTLCETINDKRIFGKRFEMVEIGCHIGESTEIFLKRIQPHVLWAIDPWIGGFDERDPLSIDYDQDYYEIFKNNISNKYDNVSTFRNTSAEMAKRFNRSKRKFEFVYLDAIHTYPAVKQDIKLWSKRIVSGGWIGGHDYSDPYFAGVKEAVDEMLGPPDYVFQDTSWLKRIK